MGKYQYRLRDVVREKQGTKCCYCRVEMTPSRHARGSKNEAQQQTDETLEHLVRLEDGGTNNLDNLALACYSCNRGRGVMDWFTYTSYIRGELNYA